MATKSPIDIPSNPKDIKLALQKSEQRYQQLLGSVSDYVYTVQVKDGQATSTVHGPACVAVTGYTAEEYTADTNLWFRMVYRKDKKAVLEQADEVRAGKTAAPLEHRIIHKDGSVRWIKNRIVPRFDEKGQLVAYDGLITDITPRKQAEEALRESEEKYRALFEASTDSIFLETSDGTLLDCNTAAWKMYGYASKEELLQAKISDLILDESIKHLPDIIHRVHTEGSVQLETHSKHKDGPIFPCEVNIRKINIGGEERLITYVRDTTERRQVEVVRLQSLEAETRAQAAEIARQDLVREIDERKRVEEALKQRAVQLALINQISEQIAAILEINSILDRSAHLIQASFNYHHVALFTLDTEQKELVMRAKAGKFALLFPPNHRLKLIQGIVGWVATNGKKLLANDVAVEPQYINLYPNVIPTRSELTVPIRVSNEVIGVLDVQSPQVDAFDGNDVLVIETLADQIAIALENARLYETVRRELAERMKAEDALRASEGRYRAISEITSDLAYALSIPEGSRPTVEWITEAFTRITGYGIDEMNFANNWTDLIHADDHGVVQDHVRAISQGQPDVSEFRIITKGGATRWLRSYGRPTWEGVQKRVIRVTGAAQDITEHKRMEQHVLGTERLAAMGHVAAVLAHEVKNPLQAIRSHLELMLEFPVEQAEREEYLRFCCQEIDHLTELTGRVLGFSRPSQDTRPQSVSISQLFQQTIPLVNEQMQRFRVHLTTDIPTDLPPLQVVPNQIVQVLLNLMLNSIEAMPKGGNVHVSASTEEGLVALRVVNDGPLIPQESLEHLFEPFFTTKPNSTGLGLFVSHMIIEQHGGSITAENLPDRPGVAFILHLPIAHQPPEMPATHV